MPRRMTRRTMSRPKAIDVAAVVAAAVFALVTILFDRGDVDTDESYSVATIAVIMAGCVALLWRRSGPRSVMVAVLSFHVASIAAGQLLGATPLVLAAMIALYTAARSADHWPHLVLISGVVIATALAGAVAESRVSQLGIWSELPSEAAFLAIPVLLGYGLLQRATRLQQKIENEAAVRVHTERLRIARDLHDVVAHSLASITLQSGVAAHRIKRDPAMAEEVLETINTTGKAALEELRGMVGVLRSTDEPTDAPLQPAPTDPDDLTDLLARAEADGLTVTTHLVGQFPTDVSGGVVIAAHRIVGEALTNAARHAGPVAVSLSILHRDGDATIMIENAKGSGNIPPIPSTGVGIEGMIERASAVGGTLVAQPTPHGGYLVEARLPYVGSDT